MTSPHRRGGAAALALTLGVATLAAVSSPAAAGPVPSAPAAGVPSAVAPAATPTPATLGVDVGDTIGEPWSLTISDQRGQLLRTVDGSALTVRTADGPARATTVRSASSADGRHVAEIATDRAGTTITTTVTTTPDGAVDVSIAATGGEEIHLDLGARPDERFLGLGERSDAVDHRGRRVENRVLDGPYTDKQWSTVSRLVPAPGYSERSDATYFPVPWVLSTAGYGLLLDNDEDSALELATAEHPGSWRASVESDRLELRVFGGPTPAQVLERMTAAVGRQPAASAPFVHGPWWQPKGDAVTELAALRAKGVPVSVAQTYTHYLPCGDEDPGRERAQTAALHADGVAVTTYVNPMICVSHPEYAAGAERGAYTKNADGTPLVYRYSTASNFQVSQIDFSSTAGRNLFTSILQRTVDDGYDGWMEDFGEYTPDSAVSADGTPGPTMHNRYVEQYHATANDFSRTSPRPLARFNRSGWTGAITESEIVWGGDPTTVWGFDGLQSALRQGLGMGLSGVSMWGSDIGGFFTFYGEPPSVEMLNRWIELGAVSGIMRLQSGGINLSIHRRPSIDDPEVAPVWERYSRLRTRLYPYLAGSQDAYAEHGLPLMRHLALVAPDDPTATGLEDEFLLGADVLAAPVVEEGATTRSAYLTEGRWVDLWRTVELDEGGTFRVRDDVEHLDGRQRVEVPAPVGQVPLFVRSGAVVPLVDEEVETLAEYGDADVVNLSDRADERTLLAFPAAGRWTGTLGTGETMTSTVADDTWTLELAADDDRTYEMQASLAGLAADQAPTQVTADGTEVDFTYDEATRALTVRAPLGADGTLVVSLGEAEEPTDPTPTDPTPTGPRPTSPRPTAPTTSPTSRPTPAPTSTTSPTSRPGEPLGPIIETDLPGAQPVRRHLPGL